MVYPPDLGFQLREWRHRQEHPWSQWDVAKWIGWSQGQVSALETGVLVLNGDTVPALDKAVALLALAPTPERPTTRPKPILPKAEPQAVTHPIDPLKEGQGSCSEVEFLELQIILSVWKLRRFRALETLEVESVLLHKQARNLSNFPNASQTSTRTPRKTN